MTSLQLTPKRAIAYFRSARADEDGSIQKQRDQINAFIVKKKMVLIHEEVDEGVSGHRAYRPGLSRLIDEWICNPAASRFEYVLMQDISRWGRFLDPSNIQYWEFLCRRHGKKVVYVANELAKEDDCDWHNPFPKQLIHVTCT